MKHLLIKTINTILILVIAANFTSAQTKQLPTPSLMEEKADTVKWYTTGFKQSNTMGGGEAAIPDSGKFRVFVLMGQSNMQGAGRANELEAPYNEKHERIRIWANGRWEYFVPTMRFGPGMSFAHQLAEFWPDDHIGIIKVAVGGTGICGFEKEWSYERAQLTFDGEKGPLYQDLMNAIEEAKRISQPEFCGFFWKQSAADGTRKILANAYYDRFNQLISDLQADLGVPNLPTFVPVYANDKDLLNALRANMNDEDLHNAINSAGKAPENDGELLQVILSYINDQSLSEAKRLGGSRPYHAAVIHAQNRAGREISMVTAIYPGSLPIGADGVHYSSEGYITLGKFTASAVEEFFTGIDKAPLETAIQLAQSQVNAHAGNIGDQEGQYLQAIFDAANNAIAAAQEALGKDLTRSGLDAAIVNLENEMAKFIPNLTGESHLNSYTFSIYPNPVSDMLFIRADNLARIKITDLSGRVLIQKEMKGNRVDVSALQDGIYFLQIVMTDNSMGTGRFVKRKL
ncbi:MAG: T9SS type A sorting domain-containing protein [Bacteroidetes bacterium]|nr:T9SS type A sorting domain-containing protein [Bacteroidota bacterium]